MKNKVTNGTKKVWGIITHNWRHIATFFFFAGFITDAWLLPDYNDPISRYLGFVYIIISALLLIIKNNAQVLHLPQLLKFNFIFKYQNIFKYILDFALPFFIGSALSFVFIYYYRSVQIAVMWPILLGLIALMCVNELVRDARSRALIEIAILMFTVYMYMLYVFPTLFFNLTNYTLILSVIFALILNMVLTRFIMWEKRGEENEINNFGYKLLIANIAVPLVIAVLYVTQNLPAVPVTLRSVRVYNDVKREQVKHDSVYSFVNYKNDCSSATGTVSDAHDYISQVKELFSKHIIYIGCGVYDKGNDKVVSDKVTVYTAVYMPGYFYKSNVITNVWMHYNEKKSTWEQMKRVSYPIASGRDGGYRGFTSVDNPPVGDWKLRIINSDNRLIGEYAFRVATSTMNRVATSTNMVK